MMGYALIAFLLLTAAWLVTSVLEWDSDIVDKNDDYYQGWHWTEVPVERCWNDLNRLESKWWSEGMSILEGGAKLNVLKRKRQHLVRIIERRNNTPGWKKMKGNRK